MVWTVDARVPLRFGALADLGADDALLFEGGARDLVPGLAVAYFSVEGSVHPATCACCLSRSPVAIALAGLFQGRATGEAPFFRRVLAVTNSAEGDTAVWAAVRSDPLVSGRFRME